MYKIALRRIVVLVLLSGFLIAGLEANAQRKKRKEKKIKETSAQVPAELSSEDKAKAELYHVEAEKYFILEDYEKSFMLYQQSLGVDPQNATAHYRIAQILLKQNNIENAIFNAQRAIKVDPTNKYFYLLLADIYTKQSNFVDAAATYEVMIEKCKDATEYLNELAYLYIYQENYDQALSIYDRIEQRYGVSEQVIAQKQKIYLKQSNLDKAVEEGQRLINAFPGESRYVLMLSEILISNNREAEAAQLLEKLIVEDPVNARAMLMLADYHRKTGELELANEYLNKAFGMNGLDIQPKIQVLAGYIQRLPNKDIEGLALDLSNRILEAHPNDPRAFEINGDLNIRLGNDSIALISYKEAIALGASNYGTWQNILQIQVQNDKYEDAIRDGEQALELFPNQSGLCWFLGTSYLMVKDYESAVEILERGEKLTKDGQLKSYFLAQLGDTYNNLEEHKKSDESYEAALVIDPDNDHVLNNYSYFLSLRKEKLDLAKKMSSKLISMKPDNPTYLDTHAWVLYVRGEYEDAKRFIIKAVEGDEVSGTIIEHYGDILFKLGDIDEAVIQWQRAKGMDETSDLIDKKIADRKLYE